MNRINIEDSCSTVQTKRVLLMEDGNLRRSFIKEFLESHFYDVVTVASGSNGIRSLLSEQFDLIICDMMTPKLPGDMFYSAVECARPDLCSRFIFITAHNGNSRINDFIRQVKGAMLVKPFSMDDLLEAVALVQAKTAISRN